MLLRGRRPPAAARERGAILIILMALLAMGVLYFLTLQLEGLSLYQKESQQGGGSDSLGQAREALLGYAATYRDDPAHSTEVFGYLPCPDTVGNGEAAATCGTAGEASVGLLPYKTLGLPDLRDSSGVCLWYAVAGSFKNNPKASATVMNWDTQGQFSVLDANATVLAAPDDSQGGAAAVIFITGPPLAGQNRGTSSSGPCNIDPTQVSAYIDGAYSFATSNAIALTQGPTKDVNGNVTSNDRLAWITPREIFDRVIKRQDFSNALTASPPGQINTLVDRLTKAVEKQIQDDIFNATSTSLPSNTASYTPQPAGAAMGDVNAATDISLTNAVSYANYLSNWSDQLRQIVCTDLSAACLTINNSGCRGALLFGGRTSTGQPRTGAQKIASMANLDNYFEAAGRALLKGSSTSFSGSAAYNGSNPGADIATCLGYGSFESLKQGAAAFAGGVITPGGAGTGVVAVTGVGTDTPAIVLGSTIAAARSGCVWRPSPLPMNTSLRLYFTYNIASATTGISPRGFILAMADAATNNPASNDPVMCGGADNPSLGIRGILGYAGAPAAGFATNGVSTADITGTAWSPLLGIATITTAASHGFLAGDSVTVSGASPTGYNGSQTITSTTATSFSYALANPGAPLMGIFPPKIGLEFDTSSNASRNDPSTDHFAFVYWGGAGDNAPSAGTRDGYDDNIHNTGVNGDGSQPFNPVSLTATAATATPVATVAAARWSAGTASITTAAPHGYTVGAQDVTVSDFSPLGYKGSYTAATFNAATVTDATHFTYPKAANPGKYPYVATVSAASWSAGTATITTSAAHGLATGDVVILSNLSPTAWNGSYTVTVTDATHFTVAMAGNPGAHVSAASWSAGMATITTSAAHGLSTGNTVTLSNMSPAAWNGSYPVTVTDSTHFTIAMAGNPGSYVPAGRVSSPLSFISAAAWSGSRVTVTTSAAHGLVSDQYVTISGASPAAYNGTYRITVINGNQFGYFLLGNPGAYSSGGSIALAGATSTVMASPVVSAPINSAVWAANVVTVTTSAAHGLTTGQVVQIAGAYPGNYDGAHAVTVIDATHFSYALTGDPGAAFSLAYPGIATVKTPFFQSRPAATPPTPPNMPYDTLVHVRLDISRSYDPGRRQATLTLRAYVGDTFALSGNCGSADFRNFARDLAELCPSRAPTIGQDGITVNDRAGPALANIYLGFTTSRTAAAGDNETISVQNLILRSQ